MKKSTKIILAVAAALVAAALLGGLAFLVAHRQELPTPISTTAPGTTVHTQPPTTVPPTTAPTEPPATEATEPPTTEATEPKPTEPKPTEPKPTEPKPTEPKPTEPKPTEPKPTEPKPTEPKPTEPKPTEPKPTEPKPTEPKPTDPNPTEPKPTDPNPTEPKPTDPNPTEPKPTEPKPTDPQPTIPPPKLSAADVFFVYDVTADAMLGDSGNLNKKIYPASLTKLFTAYTTLQHMDPETVITVGNELNALESDASVAGLQKGYRLTIEQLLRAMLMPSGCDAAYVLAVATGRELAQDPQLPYQDAMALFVEEMNRTVQALGMTGTHFTNPHGYHHADHYTCGQDLLTIARLCVANPLLVSITSTAEQNLRIVSGQTLSLRTTNYLLKSYSQFYNRYAIGLKTGTTSAAGACLMSAYNIDGRIVIIGVTGCHSYDNSRYEDARKLFKHYI